MQEAPIFPKWQLEGTSATASETVRKVLEPYIVVLNSLPKIALGPLIIIWIGTGYDAIIFMTVLVSVIVCIMNMLAGGKPYGDFQGVHKGGEGSGDNKLP